MNTQQLLDRALLLEHLSLEEGVHLYHHANLPDLMYVANEIRKIKKQDTPGIVTWQIDRNVNTTNVCVANCKFCNFFVPPTEKFKDRAYITDDETYRRKIEETFALGGDQLLLQGGHHPDLGSDVYEKLFRKLKSWYPNLRLHSLGPPEIVHISELSGLRYHETLTRLKAAGLDSLPGAGAGVSDAMVIEQLEISAKYQGYIDRQAGEVLRSAAYESAVLPDGLDYAAVAGLSNEVKQKLAQHRPQTIGQASRVQGVTPAAISLLLIHLKRYNLSQTA